MIKITLNSITEVKKRVCTECTTLKERMYVTTESVKINHVMVKIIVMIRDR